MAACVIQNYIKHANVAYRKIESVQKRRSLSLYLLNIAKRQNRLFAYS